MDKDKPHRSSHSPSRRDKHRHREHREHRENRRDKSRSRSRSRSRSPRAHKHHKSSHDDKRVGHREGREDREGHRDSHRSRRHHHRDRDRERERTPVQLPHAARPLIARNDFSKFSPVFALYLSQEKQLRLRDLEEKAKTDPKKDREVQSRWRRFVEKWNAHELEDRWYDPQLFLRAIKGTAEVGREDKEEEDDIEADSDDSDGSDDSDYGPALPPAEGEHRLTSGRHHKSGPAIPSRADLDERRALEDDDRDAERSALRLARRADRAEQRERLEDLVPRAAAGTRERKLEKKKELNEKMRGFRDRSPGGEVNDDELMGDDGASRRSTQDKKKEAEEAAAKRTFWQLRREEEQRARDQELEERRMQYRAREEETMDMLRELARQRFG